jgi:preprotein translocase subunit YajC
MGSEFGSLLILLLPLLFIGWIFMSQRKRMRQITAVQSGLRIGDEVRTTSGMFGRVTALTDSEMTLEVAPGVLVRFDRRAVDVVATPQTPPAEPGAPTDAK